MYYMAQHNCIALLLRAINKQNLTHLTCGAYLCPQDAIYLKYYILKEISFFFLPVLFLKGLGGLKGLFTNFFPVVHISYFG